MTKFHENRTKIVDFLLIVTFLVSLNNFWAPSTLKKFEINRAKIKGGCQSGGKVETDNLNLRQD